MRHQYIGTPLLNFTELNEFNINDDWTKVLTTWDDLEIDQKRLDDSPRYIHKEEDDHKDLLVKSTIQAGSSKLKPRI